MTDGGPIGMTVQQLRIIHAALIAGVFGLAAAFALVGPSSSLGLVPILRITWLAITAAAMIGAGILSGRLAARADTSIGLARSAIILWAIGEGPALLGLMFYFLTGDRLLLVLPVAAFLLFMMRYRPASFTQNAA